MAAGRFRDVDAMPVPAVRAFDFVADLERHHRRLLYGRSRDCGVNGRVHFRPLTGISGHYI